VNLACSAATGCENIHFENFDIETAGTPVYNCDHVNNLTGLDGTFSEYCSQSTLLLILTFIQALAIESQNRLVLTAKCRTVLN